MKNTTLYFKNASSDKMYIVTLDANVVTTWYGKRDAATMGYEYTEDSAADAKALYEKTIAEKLAKGYTTKPTAVENKAKAQKPVAAKKKGNVVEITKTGAPISVRGDRDDLRVKAQKLFAKGTALKAIAEAVGQPASTIWRWTRSYNKTAAA